ncbi:porin [Paraburkholderia sp. Cy-641]|uniref:porin n=1 Tax=Paraburkholderia sp. Cy-641 TaxID=2608337 RepID=UPI0014239B85|nr:porin [Paraburkholderia sp. Cy-641]NIF80461.1 porin [Paraburkholderia sp. Cy-641]
MKVKYVFPIFLASVMGYAHAQSSVTLYGIVGGGVRYASGLTGGSVVKFTNGIVTSRFGMVGEEDLGGGLKAFFRLENSFSPATGALATSNVLWSRGSWVGLSSRYGSVSMGRQLSSFGDLAILLDPNEISGTEGALVPDAVYIGNFFAGDSRFNNSIKYSTNVSGVTIGGSYALGGIAGNQRAGSSYSGTLSYNKGPFTGGIGYQHTYNPDATQYAQDYYVGTEWNAGLLRVYLSYLGVTVSGLNATSSQRRDTVPQGGIVWQVTPYLSLTAAYYYDIANNLGNVQGAGGHKQTAYVIGKYYLSKRTSLWIEADRNHMSGAYTTEPINLKLLGMSPGSSGTTGVSIGLMTRF